MVLLATHARQHFIQGPPHLPASSKATKLMQTHGLPPSRRPSTSSSAVICSSTHRARWLGGNIHTRPSVFEGHRCPGRALPPRVRCKFARSCGNSPVVKRLAPGKAWHWMEFLRSSPQTLQRLPLARLLKQAILGC